MSLIAIGLLAALGQVGTHGAKHHLPPVLEREDDPPAVVIPHVFSSRVLAPWGNFTSYQVNVNAQQQNIVGDAANEPSLCIDPANPNRIAVGWRQFDSVTSNFRQAGYGYSTNGGLTWTFPGKLQNNVFRSDPVLQSRYDGTFLYLSLLNTFYDDIWQSANAGANWSMIASAEGGDKEWFTVDNTNSSGRGFLYQIWSTAGNNWGGRQFTRSTDGGATWISPLNIPGSPYWGTLDVDSSGSLYIGGWTDTNFTSVRSQSARNPGVTPGFDLASTINLNGSIDYGSPVNPGGLTGQMWLVADRSTAAPNPIYALCSVFVNSANPADVMIAKSTDGANSWNPPVRVNDDPADSGHYHWQASVAVGPTGEVDAAWLDTRNDPNHVTSALYYSYSLDQGRHFSANIRVSPSFNQSVGYPNQNKMGDYMGIVSNSVGANIAYSATFNGEEDVYFLQIPSPVVVAPSSFTVHGGGPYLGDVSRLAAIDNNRLILTGTYAIATGFVHDLIVNGTSPSFSPKALLFNFVTTDSYPGETATISFYNWSTGLYETIGTATLTSADKFVNVLASGDLSRFVQSGSGAMQADIHISPPGGLHANWTIGIDQAVWHVIP